MTDQPILFSGPMVRAIRDRRKTQTRRVLKDQPGDLDRVFQMDDGSWHQSAANGSHMSPLLVPYAPGDRLWVRETWQAFNGTFAFGRLGNARRYSDRPSPGDELRYKADSDPTKDFSHYRSPIHMPRWASRLTLVVTDVRVHRVQEVSEIDARNEGAIRVTDGLYHYWRYDEWNAADINCTPGHSTAKGAFIGLWDDLNAKRGFGWDANPWVVAITFVPHAVNIDRMEGEP